MIRKAKVKDSTVIMNLYNEVTLGLLEKDIHQWDYPWMEEDILSMVDNLYLLCNDEDIIGCFEFKTVDLKKYMMNQEDLYLGKIAISPEYQGQSLLLKIMEYAKELSKKKNNNCYFDCWSGNNKLREVYTKYAKYLGDFKENEYYISIFQLYSKEENR